MSSYKLYISESNILSFYMFNFFKKFTGLRNKESCVTMDNKREIEKISAMGLVIRVEDDGKKIKKLILDSIKGAKTCIKIAVPWFSDRDIIKALNQKKNIRIDIIISDEGWNRVDQLEKFNLKIIARDDTNMMHHKFCIIDNNFVVCGSYNYTYNAIRNKEFVVKLEGKQVVEAFNNIFDRLKSLEVIVRKVKGSILK